jgi:MFS family permease
MNASATTRAASQKVLLRIAPFTLIIFLIYLTVGMPLAALPLQVHDVLGYDNFIVGIAIGVQALVTLLTRQFAGVLCDHRGAKFGVVLGGGVAIIASAIYLAAAAVPLGPLASLGLLLVARVASGLAESLVMTGALAWAIGTVGAQNTGRVMVWIGIGLYAAIAVGAPIGVGLMKNQGFVGGFAAVSVGMIIVSALAAAAASFIPGVAPPGGERLPFVKVMGRIAPFGAGLALATVAFAAIGAFGALDFQDRGWPGAGFALSGYGVAYVLTRLCFGGWPDRFGGARVAVWSLLIECLGQIMLWLAPHPAVALAGTAFTGIGNALVFPSLGIEAVKRVPQASRGAALGAYVACFDVGFVLAGPSTGLIVGAFGYPAAFALGALGAAMAIVVAWRALAGAQRMSR